LQADKKFETKLTQNDFNRISRSQTSDAPTPLTYQYRSPHLRMNKNGREKLFK